MRGFFAALSSEDPLESARAVLGATIEHEGIRCRIVEVEAYSGCGRDPGSHSHRGQTKRNAVMFGPPGHSYVYFNYGMYWLLNVVCGPVGRANAVLLRAAQPLNELETVRDRRPKARTDHDLMSGPGRLGQALGVTGAHTGLCLLDPSSPLRLRPGEPVERVIVGTRIGLAEGKGHDLPWRLVDADALAWVSKPHPK